MPKRKCNEADCTIKKIKMSGLLGCRLSKSIHLRGDFEGDVANRATTVQNLALTDDREIGMKYLDDVIYLKNIQSCSSTQVATEQSFNSMKAVSVINISDEEDDDVIWVSIENRGERKTETIQPSDSTASHQSNGNQTQKSTAVCAIDEFSHPILVNQNPNIHGMESECQRKNLKRTRNSPIFHGYEKIHRKNNLIKDAGNRNRDEKALNSVKSKHGDTSIMKSKELNIKDQISKSVRNILAAVDNGRFLRDEDEEFDVYFMGDSKNDITTLEMLADMNTEYCTPKLITHQISIENTYTLVKTYQEVDLNRHDSNSSLAFVKRVSLNVMKAEQVEIC